MFTLHRIYKLCLVASVTFAFGLSIANAQTLRTAFVEDIGVPDPDLFYAAEGLLVTNNAYEGLLRYKPGTTDIEPALAESWSISDDGLQYTFKLRAGVKFHDGTTLSASDVIKSFERRLAVEGGPSYMLFDVAKTEARDSLTVVVTLKTTVNGFHHYMASPYGPKIMSGALLDANKADLAKGFLSTRDAGTGAYTISDWKVGQRYVMTAFGDYWGGAPHFKRIEIDLVPEASTKILQLERGDLDMVLAGGLPLPAINRFRSNPKFQVHDFPTVNKLYLVVNTKKGAFADADLRDALRHSIDRGKLVKAVYGSAATVSNQFYNYKSFPAGKALYNPSYQPDRLKAAAAKAPTKKVMINVPSATGPDLRRFAELLQVELSRAGLQPELRDVTYAVVFEMPTNESLRPDIVVFNAPPDAPHPDAYIRINYYTGGVANLMNCDLPDADAAMDAGLQATEEKTMVKAYEKAADIIVRAGCMVNIADMNDSPVFRAGIKGIINEPAIPSSVVLRLLHE